MKTLNEKSKFKWHYGYVIIIGLIFFQALTCGLTANLNGLFFTPVMEEFGCTRAQASFYLTIFFISAAVFEPVAGWTINKFDNRWLFPVIDLIYCAGYIWTAYAKSLVVFCVIVIVMAANGLTPIVSRYFQYLGYFGQIFGVIPMVIIWPILRAKSVKAVIPGRNSTLDE